MQVKTHPEQSEQSSSRNLVKEIQEIQPRKMKIFHASFAILACSVSPTSLGLYGYSAARTGILGFILATVVSYVVNFFSFELVLRAQDLMKARSYDDLSDRVFGKRIKVSFLVISTICLLGCSTANIVYMKNVIAGIVLTFSQNVDPLWTNSTFWAVLFVEGLLLPLTCLPRFKGVSYISSVSSMLPLVILILVMIHYFLNGDKLTENSDLILFSANPNHYLETLSLLMYPLMVHPNFLTVFNQLIDPTHTRKMKSLQLAFFSELIIYSGIAYFSYLHFAGSVDILIQSQNFFSISSYIEWIPLRILTVLFLISPITNALTMNITLKVQAIDLWCKNSKRPCFWNILVSLILCQIIMIPSVFLNEIALATRLVTATFYPVICYVIPGIFYYKAEREKSWKKRTVKVLGEGMSAIFVVFSIYGAIDVGIKIFQEQ